MLDDKNSMLYWWPLVANVDVPKPATIIIPVNTRTLCEMLDGKPLPDDVQKKIYQAAHILGYPVFLRTDQASGKHFYRETCFVESKDKLMFNLYRVIEENECAGVFGLPYKAVVLREYIPLEAQFTAFWGELPIAKERRYFVRDGKVQCWHPYWPVEAVRQGMRRKDVPGWESMLTEINREDPEEIELLTEYAEKIAQRLEGYWSVDFAKGRDGVWYFIDAAQGEDSWHPACPFGKPEPPEGVQ